MIHDEPHAGQLLEAAIKAAGHDIDAAREVLGYKPAMLYSLLRGERVPSLPKAFVIEDHYGVSVSQWRSLVEQDAAP